MIRLLGAITGSALALAVLLVLVGIPQFRVEPNDIEHSVVTLPYPTKPVEFAADLVADTPEDVTPEPEHGTDGVSADGLGDDAGPAATSPVADAPRPDADAAVIETTPLPLVQAETDWYAFWSPFRSELAAAGFVEQLQRVTGLDYRVVKVKTGVYEVAFAYRDDADIASSLMQITAATGLNLAER